MKGTELKRKFLKKNIYLVLFWFLCSTEDIRFWRMSVTTQLTIAIQVLCSEINGSNIFFCAQHKKETHKCLKSHKGE